MLSRWPAPFSIPVDLHMCFHVHGGSSPWSERRRLLLRGSGRKLIVLMTGVALLAGAIALPGCGASSAPVYRDDIGWEDDRLPRASRERLLDELSRYQGTPYMSGGTTTGGIDCSGLVQLALQAGGRECPRDSDMQEKALGRTLEADAPLARGDLIFWKGHVGIMCDGGTLLHANAHHMATAREPLAGAIERIAAAGDGTVTRRARP